MEEQIQEISQPSQANESSNFELTKPKVTEESQSQVQQEAQQQPEQIIDPYEQFKDQKLSTLFELESPENQLLTCCFDPVGDHLCVGTDLGQINIYSTRKSKPLYTIQSGDPCNCLRYISTTISGHLLLACSPGSQTIELWHTTSERLLKKYKTENQNICLDSFITQSDYFCTGGYDGMIREYSLEKNIITEYKGNESLGGHANRVMCVKCLGQQVVSCAWDEVLMLWDRRTARSVDCVIGVRAFGTDAISVLSDNTTLVVGNYRDFNQLELIEISDLKKRKTINWEQYDTSKTGKKGMLYAVKVLQNDDIVAGSACDNQLRIFEKSENYKCVALDRETNGQAIYSVDAKGDFIATVGSNGFGKILKY